MRKKITNEMLRTALTAVEKLLENNELAKEYDGYAASLGPAIINSGLLPALAFYSDKNKKNRVKLLKAIAETAGYQGVNTTGLLRYVLDKIDKNPKKLAKLKREILQATAAVKLAMRNFQHSDSENN